MLCPAWHFAFGPTPDSNDVQMLAAELSQRPAVAKQTLMQSHYSSKTEVHFSATPLIVRPGTGATVLARL
jgi:hypothetical protein